MDEEAAFVVEYANNARSKCANKPCSEKIEKGCIRIGRLVSNPFHEGDQMTKWYHAECIFIALTRARATTKKIERIEDLSGRDSLENEEKVQLEEWIEKYKDLKNVGMMSKKRKKEDKEEEGIEQPKKKPKLDENKPKPKLPPSFSSQPSYSSPTRTPSSTSSHIITSPPSFQSPPPPKPKPEPKKKQPKTESTQPKKKTTRKRRKKKEDPDEYDNSEDDRNLSDGFVVDDEVVEHEDGRFSFHYDDVDEEEGYYTGEGEESDEEYRPSTSSGRGMYGHGGGGNLYGVQFGSDEDDEDDEDYEEDSYGYGEGGGGNESGEWEEIPAHLLQEGEGGNKEVDKEEYMRRHPEREVGMMELVGMGFDPSAAWNALETTNDNVQLAIDVLTSS